MHQLFYVSRATKAYDNESIQSILRISRRNNAAADITGCLLYSGEFFAQVLEGELSQIGQLAERIATDHRHTGLRLLVESIKPAREYADWSMGYLADTSLEGRLASFLANPDQRAELMADVMRRMRPDVTVGALE